MPFGILSGRRFIFGLSRSCRSSFSAALHRSLGTFGIALGTAVLFTGALISLLGMRNSYLSGGFDPDLMYLSVASLLGFGILFTLALSQTRQPENHRRLILFATIPLLPPGINRMYQVVFQLEKKSAQRSFSDCSCCICRFPGPICSEISSIFWAA